MVCLRHKFSSSRSDTAIINFQLSIFNSIFVKEIIIMSSVTERFLRYVSFDTQSDEESSTCPSTSKQKLLGAAIVEEMKALCDGYIYEFSELL